MAQKILDRVVPPSSSSQSVSSIGLFRTVEEEVQDFLFTLFFFGRLIPIKVGPSSSSSPSSCCFNCKTLPMMMLSKQYTMTVSVMSFPSCCASSYTINGIEMGSIGTGMLQLNGFIPRWELQKAICHASSYISVTLLFDLVHCLRFRHDLLSFLWLRFFLRVRKKIGNFPGRLFIYPYPPPPPPLGFVISAFVYRRKTSKSSVTFNNDDNVQEKQTLPLLLLALAAAVRMCGTPPKSKCRSQSPGER